MSVNDPIPAAYRDMVEGFVTKARAFAESGDGLDSVMFVGNLATGEHIVVQIDADDPDSKAAAGRHARVIALTVDADYSLVVGEAWSLSEGDLARVEVILEEYGALSNYPRRIEVVFFVLETRYGTWGGQAVMKLKGASEKKRTFGAVQFNKADDSGEGLLANIIKKDIDAMQAGLQ